MTSNQRPAGSTATPQNLAHVRILATTDLHMNLTSFDYYADKPDPSIGFTRTAQLIRQARQQIQAGLVLLFDNGDSLQGTPLGDWVARQDGPHPLMQAFETLRYDAIGLGNHDFGFGLDVLDGILRQAPCPVLCNNLRRTSGAQRWQRHVILERSLPCAGRMRDIRIGVFSVLPPQTTRWEAHLLEDELVPRDILTSAKETTDKLRGESCDLVIALAHSGLGQADTGPDLENAVIPLAGIDGLDAIVAGHTHLTLPGSAHQGMPHVDHTAGLIHGTPVVMPGSAGSHLGVIDLFLDSDPDTGWRIADRRSALRAVQPAQGQSAVPEDQQLVTLFGPAHHQTRKAVSVPVAHTHEALHSYFSLCAPDRGLALVAEAQAAALRPFLAGTALETIPLLSAVSPLKYGGRSGPRHYTEVPAGEICLRHIADLHVFPNELRAVVINGAQLADWLEMSAGVFNRLSPNNEIELNDRARAGYTFDILFGAQYGIDPSQPARFDHEGSLIDTGHRRVRNLSVGGSPVQPDQEFVVALTSYRASGGGNFPFIGHARPIGLPSLDIKRILRDYLAGHLPPDPMQHGPYPFALTSRRGMRAVLRTGPGAIRYLPELDAYNPERLGQDPDGFERIRLAF